MRRRRSSEWREGGREGGGGRWEGGKGGGGGGGEGKEATSPFLFASPVTSRRSLPPPPRVRKKRLTPLSRAHPSCSWRGAPLLSLPPAGCGSNISDESKAGGTTQVRTWQHCARDACLLLFSRVNLPFICSFIPSGSNTLIFPLNSSTD